MRSFVRPAALLIVIVHAVAGCRKPRPRTVADDRPSLAAAAAATPEVHINAPVHDPAHWLAARGATESLDRGQALEACVELLVGTAHEPALVCDEQDVVTQGLDELAVYRIVVHRVVRVVREGRILRVLDVRTALDADRKPYPRGRGILELTLSIARDGTSATVEASTLNDCKRAQPAAPKPYLPGQERPLKSSVRERIQRFFDVEWMERLCSARGSYDWKGDRFEPVPR